MTGNGKAATVIRTRTATAGKALGTVYSQRFFALRLPPASLPDLVLPFPPVRFSALVYAALPLRREYLRSLGLRLFHHGLRQAVCCGSEAESAGEVLDEVADEHCLHHQGRPLFCSVHDDEPLEEVMDYFILPTGLTQTSLILVLGPDELMRQSLRAFAQAAGPLREQL